ncbi:MAG: SusC/RagA family TonB-linked outer membrane protein [Bacteroidia bacterium]|nr:SusC/RagA family TonB-linked outer membrane protein [Bacteroidia bacterium]
MRFKYILYQKIIFACLLAFCILLSVPVNAQAQKEKKVRQLIDVTLKVVDENGTPIPNASVIIGEGITHTETDQNGSVAFKGYAVDIVTISALAFEKNVSVVSDLLQKNTITLLKAKIHMTANDAVRLPYSTLKRRNLTGPEVVMQGKYFEKYPSTDIRNTLTGMTSGWDIREIDGSPGLSSQEGLQQYTGLSNAFGTSDKFSGVPLVMIDGMITELNEAPLDPSDIESATLLKGILGTTMYGPAGAGGILMITTKRGVKNERLLNLDVETGVSVVDRMPGYASGAEYATLNNQARVNDGLAEKYTPTAISEYAKNDPNSLRYPSVNFRDMMLKNSKSFKRVNLSSSGGNDMVQYFSAIGYNGEGDIYNIGSTADYNRINTRQNVNVKVNDQINVQFSFYGNITYRRSPNYGYNSNFTSEDASSNPVLTLIELPSILNDINTIPPVAFPVNVYTDLTSNTPWYGVSSSYSQNPVGALVSQGYYSDKGRTGVSNITFNYDAGNIIKGLKSSTYFGFNIHDMTRIGKANDYLAYTSSISSKTGNDTIIKSSSHGLVTQSDMAKLLDYYFQRYTLYENISYDRTFGDNTIQSTLTYNQVKAFFNGIEEPQRNNNLVWSAMYSFKDKYSLQAVMNYAGTYSFDKNLRYKLFPAVGASWVVSDESFLSNSKLINYFKLRAQYGVVGNETYMPPFYYVDRWSQNSSGSAFGPYSSLQWFGSTTESTVYRNSPQRVGNPDLTWELRKEFTAGFDALLLNQKLSLDMTYWNILTDGAIVQINNTLPYTAGLQGARPWYNFTKTRYNMVTVDVKFSDNAGDFSYTLGANATTSIGTRVKYDEPNYRFDYQKRTGKVSDAIFGMVYQGKFATDAETTVIPQLYDAVLKAGDLKYQDMNNDGFIDDNDQAMIGHSSPRLYYALNATLKYKNFELYVLGAGRAFYDIALTNSYYWNGWGDNNYSNFVKDNVDGAYPRLTYYKVNNNFVTSDFWLTNGSYFKIQNVELSYTIPAKMLQFVGGRGIKIYARGANLLTISKVKDIDPESINSGVSVYPLFKTFSGGVKFNF